MRYDRAHFPEDLVFQETEDRENFQGRYVLRHPWKGDVNKCPAAAKYFDALKGRQEQEASDAGEAHWLGDRKNPRSHEARRRRTEGR